MDSLRLQSLKSSPFVRASENVEFRTLTGTPAVTILAINVEAMFTQMKSVGVNVISTNGELVDFGNRVYTFLMEDPKGLNPEPFERPVAPPRWRRSLTA